jgi:hypothetical protein
MMGYCLTVRHWQDKERVTLYVGLSDSMLLRLTRGLSYACLRGAQNRGNDRLIAGAAA